jgi:hypothetical protein
VKRGCGQARTGVLPEGEEWVSLSCRGSESRQRVRKDEAGEEFRAVLGSPGTEPKGEREIY